MVLKSCVGSVPVVSVRKLIAAVVVLWLLLFIPIVAKVPRQHAAWLPLLFVGALSPLVDLIYNYQGGLWREGTDVHDLFLALPDGFVHGFFVLAITVVFYLLAATMLGLPRYRLSSLGSS